MLRWNKMFYAFDLKKQFPTTTLEEHFAKLEELIKDNFDALLKFRGKRIETDEIPEEEAKEIFRGFREVLGQVGAAKCLHVLAPFFFPIWDARILKAYGMHKGQHKGNIDGAYVAFMKISVDQIKAHGLSSFPGGPLKGLDEYNYCRFVKGKKRR